MMSFIQNNKSIHIFYTNICSRTIENRAKNPDFAENGMKKIPKSDKTKHRIKLMFFGCIIIMYKYIYQEEPS